MLSIHKILYYTVPTTRNGYESKNPTTEPKRGPGRPRKTQKRTVEGKFASGPEKHADKYEQSTEKAEFAENKGLTSNDYANNTPIQPQKRGPGRPRKTPLGSPKVMEKQSAEVIPVAKPVAEAIPKKVTHQGKKHAVALLGNQAGTSAGPSNANDMAVKQYTGHGLLLAQPCQPGEEDIELPMEVFSLLEFSQNYNRIARAIETERSKTQQQMNVVQRQ